LLWLVGGGVGVWLGVGVLGGVWGGCGWRRWSGKFLVFFSIFGIFSPKLQVAQFFFAFRRGKKLFFF